MFVCFSTTTLHYGKTSLLSICLYFQRTSFQSCCCFFYSDATLKTCVMQPFSFLQRKGFLLTTLPNKPYFKSPFASASPFYFKSLFLNVLSWTFTNVSMLNVESEMQFLGFVAFSRFSKRSHFCGEFARMSNFAKIVIVVNFFGSHQGVIGFFKLWICVFHSCAVF